MVADLQIEAEEANGGVLLTVVDSARLTMLLTRETAAELLDAIDACMKTGERQTTRAVDVWRAAPGPSERKPGRAFTYHHAALGQSETYPSAPANP